jgi:hypothetical protein
MINRKIETTGAPSAAEREITGVEFAGGKRSQKAVVHYSDGSLEVVKDKRDAQRYSCLYNQFKPKLLPVDDQNSSGRDYFQPW